MSTYLQYNNEGTIVGLMTVESEGPAMNPNPNSMIEVPDSYTVIHGTTVDVSEEGRSRSGVSRLILPTEEEQAAYLASVEAEASARADEDARIAELRAKVGPGNPGLTQDERDELNLILLSRS